MNWTSIGTGHDAGESALTAERLDALQARLEVLERDRDSRLRDAAEDIREGKLRMRLLEDDRNAALKASIESRVRLEAAQRELEELRTRLKALNAASARNGSASGAEVEQLQAQLAMLLEERKTIAEFVDRAARSRAWRLGHRVTSFGRLLTFRRSRGTSALGRLQARLERAPFELPSAGGSTASTDQDPGRRPEG